MNPIQREIERLVQLDWSFITCNYASKRPSVKSWKPFQERKPTSKEVERWKKKKCNLAIVLGDVSGGLVVRDFDSTEKYHEWKSNHPNLAKALPTVQTSKGYHVYCQMNPCPRVKSKGVDDGELRANGSYVVAPPSRHPNGTTDYRWIIEPYPELPTVSIEDLDLKHVTQNLVFNSTLHSQHSQPSQHSKPRQQKTTHSIKCGDEFNFNDYLEAIQATIPITSGQRNTKLFELARRVKGLSEGKLSTDELIKVFEEWWIRAESIVSTKDFAVSLDDFLRGYGNAKTAFGETMKVHLNQAIKDGYPDWVHSRFPDECKRLAALCRQLQRVNGSEPFYLSVRIAGKLIGLSHQSAWHYLDVFLRLGKIQKIENGNYKSGKASLFRYCANDL